MELLKADQRLHVTVVNFRDFLNQALDDLRETLQWARPDDMLTKHEKTEVLRLKDEFNMLVIEMIGEVK